MIPITRTTLATFVACSLIAGTAAASVPAAPMNAGPAIAPPIVMTPRPGTPDDAIARQLMAPELAKARDSGETPLVLVSSAKLGAAQEDNVLFVQIQSPRECGSAGCDTMSFRKTNGNWVSILDTISGSIRVAPTAHRGMRDLIIKETRRLVWNGTKYT